MAGVFVHRCARHVRTIKMSPSQTETFRAVAQFRSQHREYAQAGNYFLS